MYCQRMPTYQHGSLGTKLYSHQLCRRLLPLKLLVYVKIDFSVRGGVKCLMLIVSAEAGMSQDEVSSSPDAVGRFDLPRQLRSACVSNTLPGEIDP
jgi:hypothetical protein